MGERFSGEGREGGGSPAGAREGPQGTCDCVFPLQHLAWPLWYPDPCPHREVAVYDHSLGQGAIKVCDRDTWVMWEGVAFMGKGGTLT